MDRALIYPGHDEDLKILLISLTEEGELASPPQVLDTQIAVGWAIKWLPDNQRFTILEQSLPSVRTDVWLFSRRDDESPIALTRDETAEFRAYRLSPDGSYIAYPAEVSRGSSLW